MVSIQSVFEDIRTVLGVHSIQLPTREDLSLPRGDLEVLRRGPTPETNQLPQPGLPKDTSMSGALPPQAQTQVQHPMRPSLPDKKHSSFTVTPVGAESRPESSSAYASTAVPARMDDRFATEPERKDRRLINQHDEKHLPERIKALTLKSLETVLTIGFWPCLQVVRTRKRRRAARAARAFKFSGDLEKPPETTGRESVETSAALYSNIPMQYQPYIGGPTISYTMDSGARPDLTGTAEPIRSSTSTPCLSPSVTVVPTSEPTQLSQAPTVTSSSDFTAFDQDIEAQIDDWSQNVKQRKRALYSDNRSLSIVLSIDSGSHEIQIPEQLQAYGTSPAARSDPHLTFLSGIPHSNEFLNFHTHYAQAVSHDRPLSLPG